MVENSSRPALRIGKWKVDARLLERREVRRCTLAECLAWCCTGGVWIDVGEASRITQHADLIKPFLPEDRRDEYLWFDGVVEADEEYPTGWGMGTRVVPDPTHPAGQTCVFLRPQDRRCAIQAASIAQGRHKWELKPFYCWLHPLTTNGDWVGLDDDNEIYLEGGSCQRDCPGVLTPLYRLFEEELRRVLGDQGFEELAGLEEGTRRSRG